MGIITRNNPVGIDAKIAAHQSSMFTQLNLSGFAKNIDWDSYDRVYGNPTEDGRIIPEHFTGGKKYKDVLFNSKRLMTSFYWLDDDMPIDPSSGLIKANVSMIVQAQIGKMYSDDTQRYDENLRMVFAENSKNFYGYDSFRLNSIKKGIDTVYKEFYRDEITTTDMSDYHVFRLDYTVAYEPRNCAN